MLVNTRAKRFPDGTRQFTYHSDLFSVGHKKAALPDFLDKPSEPDHERAKESARSRAVQAVYDLCLSNEWDYFLTGTFDPKKYNSFDYDDFTKAVILFTKKLRKREVEYVLVPEQHQSGAWHFHGLLQGQLDLVPSVNPYSGEVILDGQGRVVYNLPIYKYGFSTVTEVGDNSKASGYLCKYLSKEMSVPVGKKRYWASRGLARPKIYYDNYDFTAVQEHLDTYDYFDAYSTSGRNIIFAEEKGGLGTNV